MSMVQPKRDNSDISGAESPEMPSIDTALATAKGAAEHKVKNSRFFSGNRAHADSNSMMNRGVNLVVGILVVGLLTAYLLPVAIEEIVAVDTSAWGSAEAALFGLLPIFLVLGVVLYIVRKAT